MSHDDHVVVDWALWMQADTFVGTFTYMSPERICGKETSERSRDPELGLVVLVLGTLVTSVWCAAGNAGEEYSFSADIWALGLTIVTCALGRFPYDDCGGYWGLLSALKDRDPPDLPAQKVEQQSTLYRRGCELRAFYACFLVPCSAVFSTRRSSVTSFGSA